MSLLHTIRDLFSGPPPATDYALAAPLTVGGITYDGIYHDAARGITLLGTTYPGPDGRPVVCPDPSQTPAPADWAQQVAGPGWRGAFYWEPDGDEPTYQDTYGLEG